MLMSTRPAEQARHKETLGGQLVGKRARLSAWFRSFYFLEVGHRAVELCGAVEVRNQPASSNIPGDNEGIAINRF